MDATKRAIAEGPDHDFVEAIWRDDFVRAALEKLFAPGKCAYCESPLEETDWDVEHFRPKGRVAENDDHPGYYWLAYSWENLYPSCKPCNQRRRDKPIWGDSSQRPARGKADQFPLEDETTRAWNTHDSYRAERTLLIDPCYDTPEWYLTFERDGRIRAIDDNIFGDATISVFHLDRRRLDRKRKAHIDTLCKLLQMERDLRNAGRAADARKFNLSLRECYASDRNYFAAVARAVFDRPNDFLSTAP